MIKSAFAVMTVFLTLPGFSQQADLIMTIGGDVNFTKHLRAPEPDGVRQGNEVIPYSDYTRGLLPLIQGADVNFANIETVITEEDLVPIEKAFNFQTHPNALRHLIDIGFNLFSSANNHSHDYGQRGIEQSLMFYRQFERSSNMSHSGMAENIDEATEPNILTIRGYRIGFLAFGNTSFYPDSNRPGVLSYNKQQHIDTGMRRLREANVDLRVVSIHTGTERMTDLNSGQQAKFNEILRDGSVDLIVGHHPHVVRPVENVNGRMIFYSMGNYLMTGSANITKNGIPTDYGLMAKIYFRKNMESQKLEIKAMQAIPLTNTHAKVQQMVPSEAKKRIDFLNELSQKNLSNTAVRFQIHEATGTGQWTKQ